MRLTLSKQRVKVDAGSVKRLANLPAKHPAQLQTKNVKKTRIVPFKRLIWPAGGEFNSVCFFEVESHGSIIFLKLIA